MKTLDVSLGERSYPIHIATDLLDRHEMLAGLVRGPDVLVVTNETVGPLYLDRIRPAFKDRRCATVVLPDGEQHKRLASVETIIDTLVDKRFARDCTVVALGGGVVGDMAGFAAACYQRGVDYIQIPTTLLAQVDSAVGGKTAVNHPGGKNLIGAFHQPRCVVSDTSTLATLPDRELAAGLAEVIKYGLVCDAAFFDWIEAHSQQLIGREPDALAEAIYRSCANKARLVAQDEREAGARALLNLGHTFGHAIEAGLGYGTWLHGEAVAAGTVMAADLSARLGWMDRGTLARIIDLFQRCGLPCAPPPELAAQRMLELMALDKKVLAGRMRLVLLRQLGTGIVTDDFPPEALRATLERAPLPDS